VYAAPMEFMALIARVAELAGNGLAESDKMLQVLRTLRELAVDLRLPEDSMPRRLIESWLAEVTYANRLTKIADAELLALEALEPEVRGLEHMFKAGQRDVARRIDAIKQRFSRRRLELERKVKTLRESGHTRRAPYRRVYQRHVVRAVRRRVHTIARRTQTDSGGSGGEDGPGESDEGPIVSRYSLRPDQPQGPSETGAMPSAGYSASPACAGQLRAPRRRCYARPTGVSAWGYRQTPITLDSTLSRSRLPS
jgi:hypothetical protein